MRCFLEKVMIGRDFPLEDKLVIAVGDSFFDKKYYKRIYGANSDMYFWPEYLSPTVFCDGKAGCGNQSIFERAFDNYTKHQPDLLICQWTSCLRLDFGRWNIGPHLDENGRWVLSCSKSLEVIFERLMEYTDFYNLERMAERQIRLMECVNSFAHCPVYHLWGPSPVAYSYFKKRAKRVFGGQYRRALHDWNVDNFGTLVSEKIKNDPFFFSIQDFFNFHEELDQYEDELVISGDNHHPTLKGNRLVAEYIIKDDKLCSI